MFFNVCIYREDERVGDTLSVLMIKGRLRELLKALLDESERLYEEMVLMLQILKRGFYYFCLYEEEWLELPKVIL